MRKTLGSVVMATALFIFSPMSVSSVCAIGEPPCSDCKADPYEPSGCAVSNCCDTNNVSHVCSCSAKNSSGECTACAF